MLLLWIIIAVHILAQIPVGEPYVVQRPVLEKQERENITKHGYNPNDLDSVMQYYEDKRNHRLR